jgi:hypothetical protein
VNELSLRSLSTSELLNCISLRSCSELETELARRLDEACEYIAELEDAIEALEALLDPDEGPPEAAAQELTPRLA